MGNTPYCPGMKEAFVSYGGLRGFRADMVEADTSKEINKGGKSPGIGMSIGRPTTLVQVA